MWIVTEVKWGDVLTHFFDLPTEAHACADEIANEGAPDLMAVIVSLQLWKRETDR